MTYQFKDLGIQSEAPAFVGKNIDMEDILDQKIKILSFVIGPSTKFPGTDYMTLQLEFENKKRICFTRGSWLMRDMKKVPEDKFPIETTIVKIEGYLKFT